MAKKFKFKSRIFTWPCHEKFVVRITPAKKHIAWKVLEDDNKYSEYSEYGTVSIAKLRKFLVVVAKKHKIDNSVLTVPDPRYVGSITFFYDKVNLEYLADWTKVVKSVLNYLKIPLKAVK